ncbi:hypothetical protein KR215_001940 [Drosophila sulfurigaster]|nr:hypothetical protein KR215_001940 [Drosophila sulfurigaster]
MIKFPKRIFQLNKVRWLYLTAILCFFVIYYKIYVYVIKDTSERFFKKDYFVNTKGCQVSAFNPFSRKVLAHTSKLKPYKCTQKKLLLAQTINGRNFLVLPMKRKSIFRIYRVKKISDIKCEYNVIKRITDKLNKYSKKKTFSLSKRRRQIEVKSGATIIRIKCFGLQKEILYHDVHIFMPPLGKKTKQTWRKKRLSVLILGIDSISHLHFIRSMPLLRTYIKLLPHVEFWGYNRVGDNSYPNLIPFFSGLNTTELEKDCYNDEKNFDKCQLLFQHFKSFGYTTSFGEDTYIGGTFNYQKGGFKKIPTDFYLRPVMVEIHGHTTYELEREQSINCSGDRKYSDVLYEFIRKLVPHLQQSPHFSFFWQTQGVHDYFNYSPLIDKDYFRLLRLFETENILSSTLVLLMSDHGLRYGDFRTTYQGMLEESQPLLIAIYPEWLATAYPLALANLKKNSHSLITTYDLHATLKDLTNLKLLSNENVKNRTTLLQQLGSKIPRGISLFLPIPEIRNCHLASIPAQFCLCHKLHQISSTDKRSERAARFMVDNINIILSNYSLCSQLMLEEVQDTYLIRQDNDQQSFGVKVRLKTMPGAGLFEGTAVFFGDSLTLNGPVLRINKYGNQSRCVQNYKIEMYCHCSLH